MLFQARNVIIVIFIMLTYAALLSRHELVRCLNVVNYPIDCDSGAVHFTVLLCSFVSSCQ